MSKKVGLTKQFGGRVAALPKGDVTFAQPKFVQQEETIQDLLGRLWPQGGSSQLNLLVNLEYPTGGKVLDLSRRGDILVEVVGMLRSQPFEDVVDFLKSTSSPEDILWKQVALESSEVKLQREIGLHDEKEVGIKGVGRCRFCGSNELVFQQKQTRSGDEAMTVFVRCVACHKNWRQ